MMDKHEAFDVACERQVWYSLSDAQENKLAELAAVLEQDPETLFDFLMKAGSAAIIDRQLALGERMANNRVARMAQGLSSREELE